MCLIDKNIIFDLRKGPHNTLAPLSPFVSNANVLLKRKP